jgi:hypothetical protein
VSAWLLAAAACSQWPTDAREVLAWHAARSAEDARGPAAAEALRAQLYAYQAVGAEGEAWNAADRLTALDDADPDGLRYRVQLCIADPARWEEGVRTAEQWLAQNQARPEREHAAVLAALDVLRERSDAHRAALQRRHARAWVPWAAWVAFLLGAAVVAHRMTKGHTGSA